MLHYSCAARGRTKAIQEFLQNNSTRIKMKPKINLPIHSYSRYLESKTAAQCNLFCRSFVLFFLAIHIHSRVSHKTNCVLTWSHLILPQDLAFQGQLLICGENCGFLWSLLVISFFGDPGKVLTTVGEDKWMKCLPHFQLTSQQLYPACTAVSVRYGRICRLGVWDFFGPEVWHSLSFFWSFPLFGLCFQLTWIYKTIQVRLYTLMCCNCRRIFSD